MRLLVIEDSERLRTSLVDGLTRSGYAVDSAADGELGLQCAQKVNYDLIVLDLMLPKVDGLSLLRTLRKRGNLTHILILSAMDRIEQRVQGLQEGADDYLVKPFDFQELLARVKALARRAHGRKSSQLDFPSIQIDLSAQKAKVNGETLVLTPREYSLLEYLALDAGKPVSRRELEIHLYSDSESIASNVIDSAVATVRKKLLPFGLESLIVTRRGIGYEFAEELKS